MEALPARFILGDTSVWDQDGKKEKKEKHWGAERKKGGGSRETESVYGDTQEFKRIESVSLSVELSECVGVTFNAEKVEAGDR